MIFKKIILYITSILFLYSCVGVTDALEGKKRSENSDEFLVEKKNPLTVPPDIDELPVPLDQEEDQTDDQEDIKKVLKIDESQDENSENDNENQNSLEKSILEKIND